jgi:uncharacterized repeat protein (TIGR02543 family)
MMKKVVIVFVFTFLALAVMFAGLTAVEAGENLDRANRLSDSPTSRDGSESWAIIIGVANYQYIDDLKYPDDDARELSDRLQDIWGADHVKLLVDAEATRANIENAVSNWLAPREDADDIVLFFFAGHAASGPDRAPYDETYDEYLLPYDSLTYSWSNDISDDELDGWLDTLNSQKVVVILDTCFSGGFIRGVRSITTFPKAAEGDGFIRDVSQAGRAILAASAEDESSWEDPALQHGVFSYYILQGLRYLEDVDANADHQVAAEELFGYAAPRTVDFTVEYKTETQHPGLYDGYAGDLSLFSTVPVSFDISPPSSGVQIGGVDYLPAEMPILKEWPTGTLLPFAISSTSGTHETVDIESPHPYGNDYDNTWTLSHPGATRMRVHFAWILTERDWDYVYVKDNAGSTYSTYSGAYEKCWSDWVPGDVIKISLDSDYMITYGGFVLDGLEWESDQERHLFTSWNDGDPSTSREIIASEPATYTADYRTQYYLTVDSDYGSPQGEGWYDPGSTAAFSVSSPDDHGDGTGHAFTNWSGDSMATTPSASLVMGSPKTVTAQWKPQYHLTVDSDYGSPQGEGWYDPGSTASFSVSSPDDHGDGSRHVFTNWSGDSTATVPSVSLVMGSPKTVTAHWKLQYQLTVDSDYGSPQGEDWYDSGSTAAFSVSSFDDHGDGSRHVFTGWSGDSTATTPSASLTMGSPKTVTAHWKLQYQLTVESEHGNPQGEGWYDPGSTASFSVSSPDDHGDGSRHVFLDWSGDSTATAPSASLVMGSPKTVTAQWKLQYHLTVDSDYGSPQGEGWYDLGTAASFSVFSPDDQGDGSRHVFTNWSGDSAATGPSASLTMGSPKTVTANWKLQYHLTVDSDYGSPQGEGWYDPGTAASFSVFSPDDRGDGTRHVFLNWSGDSAATAPSASLTMNSPKMVNADWKLQYYLTVESERGSPQGEGWYDSGSTATFSVASSEGIVMRQLFDGWSRDSTATMSSSSITMDSAKTVVAKWRTDYLQLYILIGGVVVVVGGAMLAIMLITRKKTE